MKKLGTHKWLIVVGALAVVLSLAAVACGSADDDVAGARQGMRPGVDIQGARGNVPAAQMPRVQGRQGMMDRQDVREDRREAQAERREALVDEARDKMSPEDQKTFDQLKATIEGQRTAMQEARQDLADTLKELRALVDKYLDAIDSGTN